MSGSQFPSSLSTGFAFQAPPEDKPLDISTLVSAACRASGRSHHEIHAEMSELWRGPGGITANDYFKLSLYDDDSLSGPKSSFVGERGTRSVWAIANHSPHWFGPMMDKVAFGALMSGFKLPTPQIVAQFGPGPLAPESRHLSDHNALVDFLSDRSVYPLFCKPRISERSYGAVSAVKIDEEKTTVELLDGQSVKVESFAHEIEKEYGDGYFFQKRLEPCPAINRLCGARVATVRVYTLTGENGPEVFRVVWKIPVGANMADNFWRDGNILAAVDRVTGRVTRAISGCSFDRKVHEYYPHSQMPLVGIAVPMLLEIETLALAAARVFADIKLIGWDIAATAEGPVLVEGNFAPDFALVQLAEGRGVLDDALDEVLRWCRGKKVEFTTRVCAASIGIRDL